MKMIMVVIKLFKVDDVCDVLVQIGVQGMIVIEVKGFGCQKGYIEFYWGVEYVVDFVFKVKLELVVVDECVDQVVEVIVQVVSSGKIGDGKIFIIVLEQVLCICIGEIDNDVL